MVLFGFIPVLVDSELILTLSVGGHFWQVLGMERLKAELQSRGLKCGGTLQERATRLFLLKAIPFEKLPKKVLAAKNGGK